MDINILLYCCIVVLLYCVTFSYVVINMEPTNFIFIYL